MSGEKPDLKSSDGGALEAEVSLEVLGDLTNEPLEGQLPDEQLGRLLIATDLAEGHGAGPVPVRLLDSTWKRGSVRTMTFWRKITTIVQLPSF